MSPAALITKAVRSLGGEEAQILELLYGFDGRPRCSPRQAGEQVGCPEDVVEILKAAALKKLRQSVPSHSITEALDHCAGEIWAALAGPDDLLFKSELDAALENRLPGEFHVALQVRYGGIHPWLETYACETPRAWYRGRYSCEQVRGTLDRMDRLHQQIRLPFPVQGVAEFLEVDLKLLILAVKLTEHLALYKGYIVSAPAGALEVRTVELHLLFASLYRGSFAKAGRVLLDHNARFPGAAITLEYAEMILLSNPHLFLLTGEMGWLALGLPRNDLSYLTSGVSVSVSESNGIVSRRPIFRGLEPPRQDPLDFLHRMFAGGPLHAVELLDHFKGRFGRELVMKSLSALVQASHDIVMVAPEIFMLREHLSEPAMMESAAKLHLTVRHCRIYAMARHAGEPADAYPLWQFVGEERLCQWAESGLSRRLFSSLLAMVDPQSWNAPQALKDLWGFKKSCLSRHFPLLQDLKPAATIRRPTLEELFCAALCARELGYTNWLRIRRNMKGQLLERLSDQDGAPVLALLIGLEVLTPADHWQKRHVPGPRADSLLQRLSSCRCRNGSLDWEDEIGLELIRCLQQACDDSLQGISLGWVNVEYLQRLVQSLSVTSRGRARKTVQVRRAAQADGEKGSDPPPSLPALTHEPRQLSLPLLWPPKSLPKSGETEAHFSA